MKTNVKKISIISLSIIFIVSMLFGLFFNSLTNKNKLVEATPADTYYGTDNFYFHPGASVRADSVDPYRIRFFLCVSDENFLSDSDVINLSINPEYSEDEVRFISGNTITKADFKYRSDLAEEDVFAATIEFHARLHYEFCVNATLNSVTVTSDTRSVYYIWEKVAEDEYAYDYYDEGFVELVQGNVEFSQKAIAANSVASTFSTRSSTNGFMVCDTAEPMIYVGGKLELRLSLTSDILNRLDEFDYETNSLTNHAASCSDETCFYLPTIGIFRSDSVVDIGSFDSELQNSTALGYFTLGHVTNDSTTYEYEPMYTDSWNVVINYMEQYKSSYYQKNSGYTPFFTKKSVAKSVKVSEVDDIYNIPYDKLASIVGVESFKLLELSNAIIPTATFDDIDTYTYDLTYSFATVNQINYNGKLIEIQIPLTNYKDWIDGLGQDWSIKYLNRDDSEYFKYTNDVAPENLYGFFSVLIYDTRVSDFNKFFEEVSAKGCVTINESEVASGSSMYEWFGGLYLEGNIINSAIGATGMFLCETFNNDNTLYHSYFLFLDGTVASPYHSNSGAESSNDTDSSSENFFDDLGESFSDWLADLQSSPLLKTLKIIGFVIIGVVAFGAISWIWRIFKSKK